jgi:hypothetical protein
MPKTGVTNASPRVLCSHCEKVLTPKGCREDDTVIEAVERLLPSHSKSRSDENEDDEESPMKKPEDDKDFKKKMQMKEDFGVFVTMAVIVFIAMLVTVLKIAVQSALANAEAKNQTGIDANNGQ